MAFLLDLFPLKKIMLIIAFKMNFKCKLISTVFHVGYGAIQCTLLVFTVRHYLAAQKGLFSDPAEGHINTSLQVHQNNFKGEKKTKTLP